MFKFNLKIAALLLACCSLLLLSSCQRDNNGGVTPGPVVTMIPDDVRDIVIYSANPKVFEGANRDGLNAINSITARLDHIQALGTNVLWVMPIFLEGIYRSKGSPYSIKNYTEIDPKYGTIDDFRNLVREAHRRGIAVIKDWVGNHTAFDHHWVTEHPDWYNRDEDGNIVSPNRYWLDVADLNFDNMDMQNAMIEAMKFWIRETNIDGFRLDAVDYMRPTSKFWDRAVKELRASTTKDILLFAEGNRADWFAAGMDIDFGWNFYTRLGRLFDGTLQIPAFFTQTVNERNRIPEGHSRVVFTNNHDKSAWEQNEVQRFNGERGSMAAFVMTATLVGVPMIYSTQEIAFPYNVGFFDNEFVEGPEYYFDFTQICWDSNPTILNEYKRIMSIYTTHAAMRRGALETFSDNPGIAYYTLTYDGTEFLIAVNVRNEANTLTLPEQFVGVEYIDLMADTNITMPATVDMAAYQYFIWKRVR